MSKNLETHIRDVRQGIQGGRFTNEAAVSQGIVLRLLSVLGWPTYDTETVAPEYRAGGGRVDYALCDSRKRPLVFVEVKQVGQSEGAERQLFEYAFHTGVPLAIMTDGQEWHFFLPAERGRYEERRVYKLDLLERELDEIAGRLQRYLTYDKILSGDAIEAAREDYRDASRQRQVRETFPLAWRKLLEEADEALLDVLADKVESLCGYRPTPGQAKRYLTRSILQNETASAQETSTTTPRRKRRGRTESLRQRTKVRSGYGFSILGTSYTARNAKDVMVKLFKVLAERDEAFLKRFAALPEHGRTRRYLARSKERLYPGRPDLADRSEEIKPGWWMGTNYGKRSIRRIIKMGCDTAGLSFGEDVEVRLGE